MSTIASEARLADVRARIADSARGDAPTIALLVAFHEILRRRAEAVDAAEETAVAEPRRFDPERWPENPGEKLDLYERLVHAVRATLPQAVPAGSRVLIVSRGDDRLVGLPGLRAEHFPQDERGSYAGHYPRDGASAVAHLEALRAAGAEFLALPATAFWWLDHYPELACHLMSLVAYADDDIAVYDLRSTETRGAAT